MTPALLSRLKPFLFLILSQAIWLIGVPLASAAPPSAVSVGVSKEEAKGQAIAVYRIAVTSGESASAIGLSYDVPSWPTPGLIFGSPLTVDSVRLVGPGTIRPLPTPLPAPVGNSKYGCSRGKFSHAGRRFWVETPAGATSSVELRARPTFPSWPDTSYRLSLSSFLSEDPGAEESVLKVGAVPRIAKRGTHIQLRSTGKPVGARWSPELVGKTSPPLRNSRVRVRVVRRVRPGGISLDRWNAMGSIPIVGVRTNRNGRFVVPPKFISGGGLFAFLARTQASSGVAADWTCGPSFKLQPESDD